MLILSRCISTKRITTTTIRHIYILIWLLQWTNYTDGVNEWKSESYYWRRLILMGVPEIEWEACARRVAGVEVDVEPLKWNSGYRMVGSVVMVAEVVKPLPCRLIIKSTQYGNYTCLNIHSNEQQYSQLIIHCTLINIHYTVHSVYTVHRIGLYSRSVYRYTVVLGHN